MEELTSNSFWELFWGDVKLPVSVDMGFKNDRVIANTLLEYLPRVGQTQCHACEIGCAPGKWLSFLNKELGYIVHGIEYLESGVQVTRKNLASQGVAQESATVEQGDFLHIRKPNMFDVVLSLGFVEHFSDLHMIVRLHAEMAKTNGIVVIGMPSFRGLNYLVQKSIDRDLADPLIPAHNLQSMDIGVLLQAAVEAKLSPLSVDYVGGFEPSLFPVGAIRCRPKRKLFAISVKLAGSLFSKSTSRLTASYIIGVFKKREDEA